MNPTTAASEPALDRGGWRTIGLACVLPAFHALVLVLAGGGFWPGLVLYLVTYAAIVALSLVTVAILNPEVLNARGTRHEDAQSWDKAVLGVHTVLMLTLLVTAGLDAGRWQWSSIPVAGTVAGMLLLAAGSAITTWALVVNRHFEPMVRLQADRAHTVVTSSPYRWVRHPGYLGMMLALVGIPLVLGSWLALIPAALDMLLLDYRARREDRFLLAQLAGYAAYAAAVTGRVIPGRAIPAR